MKPTARFKLTGLIELGPYVNRYAGILRDGNSAEICLFHSKETNRDGDSDPLRFWFRRIKLSQLIGGNSCQRVLDFDSSGQQPFVAFAGESMGLEDLLADYSFIESQLESLAWACVSALVGCADVGLVVGGLTSKNICRVQSVDWQVDVSGLRCSMVENEPSLSEWITLSSPATDLRSLAVLLNQLIDRCELRNSKVAQKLSTVFADCLADDLTEVPTAKEVLHRFSRSTPSILAQGNELASEEAEAEFGATIEVVPDIVVPSGYFLEGAQLGRYTIRERLGSGGMGAVYRAEDPAQERCVAIKILNKQVTQDSIAAKRFAKEARLLAKANNPYVANLFEVVSEGDLPYMVVEFVEGGTLGTLLKSKRPLHESFALTVMIDAIRGLAIAHSRDVVHRDFKPDNVLLTADTKNWLQSNSPFAEPRVDAAANGSALEIGKIYAKVSDFGLARTAQQSESMALTREGVPLGTPLYMSPEQWQGRAIDARTDVYSIGVTLFHLLSGIPPFEAESHVGLLNLHCNVAPPSLKKLRPQLSDALVQTLEKCLAKNPDARYADAGELLIDLENILRGQPTSLGLHPPVLSLNDPAALQFEHVWELQSSPHQLWPYISNTDRVNHAIGLPAVTYSTRQDPIHGMQRFAETKVAGLMIRWQEHPYEWIEGRRMSVLREFTHGPFRWFVNIVELTPTPGAGTRVTQKLIVAPRNWLGRQLAKMQLGQKSKANFGRAYKQIDQYVSQSEKHRADRDPFIARTELRSTQKQRLRVRIEQLRQMSIDPRVIDCLAQFLENASDLEVARIRPIAFAERFQLDPNQVINACLQGTRLGVFSLLWDILCPSCRIPADVQQTLAVIKEHSFCEACNLNFDVDLADSVELVFRAHPEIREVTTAIYCVGGPAWSRHVVAQVRLAAGERFACELNLSEGAYMIRGLQLPFTIEVRVMHNCLVKRAELSLAKPPENTPTRLAIGSQVIHLCNESAVDQQIRIERTAGRHDALSAARASTMALFRELFPYEVLSADQIVSVAHITVLRVDMPEVSTLYEALGDSQAFGKIRAALHSALDTIKENSGAVVKTIGEGALAAFPDAVSAVRAAVALLRQAAGDGLPVAVAVHSGAAMVATVEDRLDYFGKTLQTLEKLLATAEPQSLQISSAITGMPEVQSYLQEQQLKIVLSPKLQLSEGDIVMQVQA